MPSWLLYGASGYTGELIAREAVKRGLQPTLAGIEAVNFAAEYKDRVFAEFLREYQAGRTPNPDVLCNREIKFGDCLRHALRLGGDALATGHYARIVQGPSGPELHKGVDGSKDQSYFLHAVKREAFARALMPLGELHKQAVRELAHEAGLPVAAKRDSTGICFIGERPFREFLSRYLDAEPGPIRSPEGRTLGEHAGLPYYTIGQRQGLGIGGRDDADDAPWYVAGKDAAGNTLIVVQGDHPLLYSHELSAARPSWIGAAPAGLAAGRALECAAKVRYRQPDQACRVHGEPGGGLRVAFERPQRAVAPGQFVVFYDREHCLGGAVIERTGSAGGALRAAV